MGSEYFANHAWGIDLAPLDAELCGRAANMLRVANEIEGLGSMEEWIENNDPPQDDRRLASRMKAARTGKDTWDDAAEKLLMPEVVKSLREDAIDVPEGAHLIWTGEEDSRPGRCHTPPDTVIVGYGMLRDPTAKPLKIPRSFTEKAEHKLWVAASY